ncbi:MAG TPA: putative quinol monooxygenase [Prolixibacteraceae bacterium]
MKRLVLLLAIISITSLSYAQQHSSEKKSEPMKKTVIARLAIKKEVVDNFVQFAQKIVEETRKEAGCISYCLYKNSFGQEAQFIFYEEYKDQAALDYHNKSEHLKQFLSQISSLLAGAPIVEVF